MDGRILLADSRLRKHEAFRPSDSTAGGRFAPAEDCRPTVERHRQLAGV